MSARVVFPGDGGQTGPAMRISGRRERRPSAISLGQARRDTFEHPGPAQIQAVQVGQLAVRPVGDHGNRKPIHNFTFPTSWNLGQKIFQPAAKFGRRKNTAHQVGLGQNGREEVLSRGFEAQVAVAVGQVETTGSRLDQGRQFLIPHHPGIVPDQAEGKGGLAVLPRADGVGQLGQPVGQSGDAGHLQGTQRLGPGPGLGLLLSLPLLQLGRQLQQPGQTVGPLPGGAILTHQVVDLGGDVIGSQVMIENSSGFGRQLVVRVQAGKTRQQPVAVDRGMPIKAPIKGGMQTAGRALVGIGLHGVADLVGILLHRAVQGQLDEGRGLRGGEARTAKGSFGRGAIQRRSFLVHRIATAREYQGQNQSQHTNKTHHKPPGRIIARPRAKTSPRSGE